MIVRKLPPVWYLFFLLRGSVLPKVLPQILFCMVLASVVGYCHAWFEARQLVLTPAPFTLLGLALSIFLGFRNSAAYDRYWEGRKLWGDLVITCRSLARQGLTLIQPEDAEEAVRLRRRMIRRIAAFAHALRHHLRDSDPADDLARLLGPEDRAAVLAAVNRPNALLGLIGQDLAAGIRQGLVAPALGHGIDRNIDRLSQVLGGCERIKTTPIPLSYGILLHRTAYLYCVLLPFGLIESTGIATPFLVGIISYTFFGYDAIGDEIEEPFGTAANDLPLSAISQTIEIDLRGMLGETDLPPRPVPINYQLI